MSEKIISVVQSNIVPGKQEELKSLLEEMIEFCRQTEPGLLAYDWYINEAGTTCTVIEQYQDSNALLYHGQNYQRFTEALNQCRTIQSLVINGNVSDQLRQLAEPMGAVINSHFCGL